MSTNTARAKASRSENTPFWWLRWLPVFILVLFVGWLLYATGRVAIVPVLASFALAYLLEPAVTGLANRGFSRSVASVVTLALASLGIAAVAAFVVPPLWRESLASMERVGPHFNAENAAKARAAIRDVSPFLDRIIGWRIERIISDPASAAGVSIDWFAGGLSEFLVQATAWLDLLIVPFFVYYILRDGLEWRKGSEDLIPPRFRTPLSRLLDEIGRILQSYVRGQLLIALLMAGMYAAGFAFLGVPAWAGLAAISGLLNAIPYVGTLAGMVLALAFTLADGGDIWRLLGVVTVFAIVQLVEGYVLTPRILGGRLNLHPMAVFLGLLIGGRLFGLLGILLAIPTIAVAKVFLMFLRELYRGSYFYHQGEDSTMALPPDAADKLAEVAEVVLAEQEEADSENAVLAPDNGDRS